MWNCSSTWQKWLYNKDRVRITVIRSEHNRRNLLLIIWSWKRKVLKHRHVCVKAENFAAFIFSKATWAGWSKAGHSDRADSSLHWLQKKKKIICARNAEDISQKEQSCDILQEVCTLGSCVACKQEAKTMQSHRTKRQNFSFFFTETWINEKNFVSFQGDGPWFK